MNSPSTRRVMTCVAAACLLIGCGSQAAQRQTWPFTPDVEEFIDIYVKVGGDKLTNWVQGEKTSPPGRALDAFRPIQGLMVELVASEPVIRQPIDLHFDDRGRLWVVQYLQYPFPAGVTITQYDQYLRARYSGVPAAPPHHVRGADKITVLEDTNGDGTFDSHRDVITGLNITTSVLTGRGGVWVMNPPYLLFYPDRTGDGLPDGDPEVRLSGFGLEDTHSLANSLTWGPDGWLYGVHGSTSTARVRGISFLGQAVWRYHPERDLFELFAEGGGNPWTLSFDGKGRPFSGDNGGNSRGFHWVRGGRYEKNWPKHGPFTRPHSYGSIGHMDHEGYAARFAMTGVIYEEGKLPGYEGQLISGMALTSRIQATRLLADGSTFRTVDTEALVTTTDRSFRPVDTAVGPDGAIYFADWCDIRMDHTDPRDTWDKSCGRIWRLRSRTDERFSSRFNLGERSNQDLLSLLGDSRKWYRDHARRLLSERGDRSLLPELRRLVQQNRGHVALEALWAANQIAGPDPEWMLRLLDHPDAPIRAWALRFFDPARRSIPTKMRERLVAQARTEVDAEVRSELADAAGRLQGADALAVLNELIRREEDVPDRHIPLRIWWTLEDEMTTNADAVLEWLEKTDLWASPLFERHLAGRIARRLAADRGDTPSFTRLDPDNDWKVYALHPRNRLPGGKGDYTDWATNYTPSTSDRSLGRLARLLAMAPAAHRDRVIEGARAGLEQGVTAERISQVLLAVVHGWWANGDRSPALVGLAALLGHAEAMKIAPARGDRVSGAPGGGQNGTTGQERGRMTFLTYCAPCHQTDGTGMERLAAPLRNSPWVLGREELLARIVLNGLKGELVMPPLGALDDQQIADVLTYIRGSWGHQAGPVSADAVTRARAASAGKTTPWTREELSAAGFSK